MVTIRCSRINGRGIVKRNLFNLLVLSGLVLPGLAFAEGGASDAQLALLDTLPADQRESILVKMRQAENLQDDLEETFEKIVTVIERPDKDVLSPEEEAKYLEESKNWIYGYEQFQTSPTTFAPSASMPIPSNFLLGPGDQIAIQYYGSQNQTVKKFISRSGQLSLPLLGPVTLAGLTITEAQQLVERKVSSELIGTSVDLNLTKLRSITVYVLGEAYSPGSYTVGALSTLTNILFVSGGVNESGSVRNIEIKRKGKTIYVFDFYDLLLKGDTKSDVRLQDGDVIFIPLLKKTARAQGYFRRPHLYEIKEGDTVEDLIYLAGGFTSGVTEKARLELSSINAETQERDLDIFLSTDEGKLSKLVKDGDAIKVSEFSSLEESSIRLSGEVMYPGTYAIQKGEKLLDIMERAGGLSEVGYPLGAVFTRKKIAEEQKISFERSANLLEQAIADALTGGNIQNISSGGLAPVSVLISRLRNTRPIGRLIVNTDPLVLKKDPFSNILLEDGDSLYIPKRPSSINVVGEVNTPSSHTFSSDVSINEYIRRAGGLRTTADSTGIYVILPNGESSLVNRRGISRKHSNLLPGSTVVVPRDPRPFDWLVMTRTITPIFANLATSAAAIAAISDD